MIPRLRNLWYRASGTDARPEERLVPRTRTPWSEEQMSRYQEAIQRQLDYVNTELEALRRVVNETGDGEGRHDYDD